MTSRNIFMKLIIKFSKANSTLSLRPWMTSRWVFPSSSPILILNNIRNPAPPVSKSRLLMSRANNSSRVNPPKRNCANLSATLTYKKHKKPHSLNLESKSKDNLTKSTALSVHQLLNKASRTKRNSSFSRKVLNLQHFF